MKLTIQQDPTIPETEVILRCPVLDPRLESLVAHIRQYSFVLVGYQEQREFRLPLESIYYVDSTDSKTFLYQKQAVYSFDISFQNEFTQEENIALARQFLTEHFVSRGMVVDFAVHEPEKEEGGINNPHFHFLCPIRPIEQNGKWGLKQKREYVLDESGNRIPDGKGDYVFNAVPTTDWGSAETLEFWREQWAVMCNAKFEEKGLDVRIDHRSYERQGIELLPTVHEGPTVRAMEKKGIKTEKGEFNRWIRATNAFIRNLRKNLSALLESIKEIKAELDKPQSDTVIIPLQRYFDMRNAKAYSQKAKVGNLKELNAMVNYLKASEIYTIEDLESRVSMLRDTVDELKVTMDKETTRMKEIRKMPEYASILKELKPIVDGLQKIKFDKAKAKYKVEHEKELKQYYAVRRKLLEICPDGKYDPSLLDKEYMVNAVYVHAPDKSSGHRVQDVTISYNYIGILPANLLYDVMNGKAA